MTDQATTRPPVTTAAPFKPFARLLHWTMAIMVLAMLFIGVAMMVSVTHYDCLVALHRPLGIAILLLVIVRIAYRSMNPPPPLPDSVPGWQKFAAHASHYVLYALMLALPLVGWSMLSAGNYPIVLWGPVHLPPILSPDPMLYATLRKTHTALAYLLYLTIMAHLGAALLHGLILRDGVFGSMARLQNRIRPRR